MSQIELDFSELESFQKKIGKLLDEQHEEFYETASKELAARLLRKVIKKTPVGKKPKLGPKTITVKGASGKKRTFTSKDGAILEKYWSGYVGGTLRRGWTAKTEEEAENGGSLPDPIAYARSLPIRKCGDEYTIEIINPVHYASYVESGHRQTPGRYVPQLGRSLKAGWVGGSHMLVLSEDELRVEAPRVVEQLLNRYLREALDV